VLRQLLDEHFCEENALHLRRHLASDAVTGLQSWQGGRLLQSNDRVILSEAIREGLAFVTRDISTIVPLLRSLAAEGESHAGVIFVDHLAVPEGNTGAVVKSVAVLWGSESLSDWTNVVIYVRPAPK